MRIRHPTRSFRCGPPRGVGGLGLAVEVWKQRRSIWAAAEQGRFGRLYDVRLYRSYLRTLPVGAVLPGDRPVGSIVGTFFSDVSTEDRVEYGNRSSEYYIWVKGKQGYWHLRKNPGYDVLRPSVLD